MAGKYAKLCDHRETLTYYRLPLAHHKHMKSSKMLERLSLEIERRTPVVRILTNADQLLAADPGSGGRNSETRENELENEHLRERK